MRDTLIIGAGLSGLTVAQTLRVRCYGHRFLLLEKAGKAGGAIRSHAEDGFIAEAGPHGFLDNCRESQDLLSSIGLDSECIHAPLSRFSRYVYLQGALRQIPQTPLALLTTTLMPWKEKFRVLADLWKKPLEGEPTVAQWASYHFGPALLPFVDAALTGTYAGDMDRLAIGAVMPGLRQQEQLHGSIIRAILAAQRNRTGPRRLSLPAMTSFKAGMQSLPDRLVDFLPETDLLLNCGVTSIDKTEYGWQVESSQGSFQAANLVLALPVNASLALLKNFDIPAQEIPEAWIATVVLAFAKEVRLPPGFGYLAPESEGRFSLGALFSSNMFPGRAPAGCTLIEVLVGGRRHPERVDLNDGTLIQNALQDIKGILGIAQDPIHARVLRNNGGIPQPEQGYAELLAWRNQTMGSNPGLFICGFGWDGIGINHMIKAADGIAERIMGRHPEQDASIKGVYF
ncbi:MAG: protoporphyrinogen oxidase [Desulfocapsaceae bacterium]|nr:protoporphyrinogen oxidase [Desulfocapsaceae bacterium]